MWIERSKTFVPGRTMWRVVPGRWAPPIWGPFCFSRLDAVWQWLKINFH